MTTLPPETWLRVAGFLASSDLHNMLSVNRTFFQLAMNARYYEAKFAAFDDGDSLGFVRRLRDPGVAQRVRRLRVIPEFSNRFNIEYRAGYNRRPWQDISGDPWNLRIALDTIENSLDELIQAMTETVPYLTNITHFVIYWRHISPSVEHLRPFLTSSWRAIGSSVQKLELIASMNYMPGLISTAMTGTFAELRELNVQCHGREHLEIQEEPRTTSIASILAPFIDKVAPTLRDLSIWTLTPELEISPVLNQLSHIPHLERLFVGAWWCELHFVENTTCLSRFLQSHAATLRCFHWVGGLPGEEFRSKDEFLVDFLSGDQLDEAFSNLLELELPVPESDVGFRLLLRYIKRSASTLTYLRLWDGFLTYDKVDMLVSSFNPRPGGHPKELVLSVEVLSPELVLLLARACPCLETLNITASYVSPINEIGQSAPDTAEEELSKAREFAHRLRKYDFRDWLLYDIHLNKRCDSNIPLYSRVMLLFGECIPSVQKFMGSDYPPCCIEDLLNGDLTL